MQISENGLNLIMQFEGCRLQSYKDSVGVWTIGYGHTNGVKEGQVITKEQAKEFLKQDCYNAEKAVLKYDGKYHFNQNQFDALVSFAFNIGSIDQLTANGTRTVATISNKILLYNKAGGKTLAGLVERRKAEKRLFDLCVVSYYTIPEIETISIEKALGSIGEDGSFRNRCKIASANKIYNYCGTSVQNLKMLDLLKHGKLIKP